MQRDRGGGRGNEEEYVVEALTRIRVNDQGEKQVRVRWEGYRRETWEPYAFIKLQLPEMVAELEAGHVDPEQDEESTLAVFVREYIARHKVDRAYRWRPDRLNVLELEAEESSSADQENSRGAETKNHGDGFCTVMGRCLGRFIYDRRLFCSRLSRSPLLSFRDGCIQLHLVQHSHATILFDL